MQPRRAGQGAPAMSDAESPPDAQDEGQTERVVLDLLVQSYPAPWTVVELARAVVGRPLRLGTTEPATYSVEDALSHLYAAGLVHPYGAMYIASRAAIEGQRLYDADPAPEQP